MRNDWYHRLALATALTVCVASSPRAQLAGMAAVRAGVPVAVGPFELSTSGSVDQIASPTRPRTAFSVTADIRAPIGNGALWIGSALEGAREIDTTPVRPRLRFGVSHSFKAIQMSVAASSHAARLGGFSVPISVPGVSGDSDKALRSHVERWSELESRLSWSVSRATFAALVGTRPTVVQYRPTVWGHMDVTYAVSPYVSLVGAMGTDAPRLALGIPAVRFASAGLRLGAWPSSKPSAVDASPRFLVRPAGERRYAITYQAPNASLVELSGDFDRWKPAAFDQVRPGVWEMTIVAAPGTYHVNLRVDGGRWLAPPGLAQAEDDFSGAVGILVLR